MSDIKALIDEYRAEAQAQAARADTLSTLLAVLVDHVGGEVKVQRKNLDKLDVSRLRVDASKKTFITFSLIDNKEKTE